MTLNTTVVGTCWDLQVPGPYPNPVGLDPDPENFDLELDSAVVDFDDLDPHFDCYSVLELGYVLNAVVCLCFPISDSVLSKC